MRRHTPDTVANRGRAWRESIASHSAISAGERGESRLEVVQPAAYPLAALALPHCPPGAIEAELYSVGGGEADDYRAAGADDGRLQGKIVLCAARVK